MPSISGVGGASQVASNIELQTEFAARTARLVNDATELQGQQALQLIDAASISGVGTQLDLRA